MRSLSAGILTLIFSRLDTKRARAFGYSVFYGALLAPGPLTTALSTLVLDNYDFPAIFHFYIMLQLPGALLLVAMLHNVRLKRRIPLYQLEWPSFVLFAATLVLLGCLAAYGQQHYWLEDKATSYYGMVSVGLLGLLLALIMRPPVQQRPTSFR